MTREEMEQAIREYLAAFEARDIPKCVNFFADDAVINFQDTEYEGLEAIEVWHRERFQANLRLNKVDSIKVKDDEVTVDGVASSDRLAAWKIKSLNGRIKARFENGKIQEASLTARMTNIFDLLRQGE